MDPSMFVETTREEQKSCEENAGNNCFLSDAERNINELNKKFNDIDDVITESRTIMNSLSEKLDLTGSVIQAKDEQHKTEMAEKLNFKPGSGQYPATPTTGNLAFTNYGNLCFTNCGTSSPSFSINEGKSHLDTRSKVAVEAISKALGPLSPKELDEVRRNQNIMYIVRQFTNDVDSLLQQLVWVKDALGDRYKENVSKPDNRPADLERRLFKRLESLIENELFIQHQAGIENNNRNCKIIDEYGATAKEEKLGINEAVDYEQQNVAEDRDDFHKINSLIRELSNVENEMEQKMERADFMLKHVERLKLEEKEHLEKSMSDIRDDFKPGSGQYPGIPTTGKLEFTNYGNLSFTNSGENSPNFRINDGKSYLDTRSKAAVEAISKALGPLSPKELDEVRRNQNIMYIVRQFTNDVDSLLLQLVWVKEALNDRYKEYVSKPGNRPANLDRRLFKRLESLIDNIELSIQQQGEIENNNRNCEIMDNYGATAKEEKLGIKEAVDYVQQNVAEVRDDFHKMNSLIRELCNVKNEMEQKMERADFMLKHVDRLKPEEKEDLEKSMSDIREDKSSV